MPGWALGLMTGTVMDGFVDLALLRTDGERVLEFGPWRLAPYPVPLRQRLAETLLAARSWSFDGPEPAIFREAEEQLTRAQAQAVLAFLDESAVPPSTVQLIGFHGQTVLHRGPRDGLAGATKQLGDGALMARLTGIPVVYDFRSADVLAGGQGAPLVPSYHAALLRRLGLLGEAAMLNLGGVGNITWAEADGALVACDTGPGNAPLNDWVERATGDRMDRDGALAACGRVDEARLARLLEHPWLAAPPPKSLDRFDFPAGMAEGLSLTDGAATLTAFTAACVGRVLDLLPSRPSRLIVCGGGRKNPAMMAALRARAGVAVTPAEEAGLRGDAIEAECFAFLAMRSMRGLPLSFPSTTGVPKAMTGGVFVAPPPSLLAASPARQ
jgi:anhydro-N-acetylmuramic acid kinase